MKAATLLSWYFPAVRTLDTRQTLQDTKHGRNHHVMRPSDLRITQIGRGRPFSRNHKIPSFNPLGRVGSDLVNFEKKNGSDRPFDAISPPWLCIMRSEWNVGTGQSPGQSPGWLIWTQHVPEDSITKISQPLDCKSVKNVRYASRQWAVSREVQTLSPAWKKGLACNTRATILFVVEAFHSECRPWPFTFFFRLLPVRCPYMVQ
jgi:hypothetical protein